MLILSMNIDNKIVTELLIAICHQTGDKLQSKNTVSIDFDPRLSIVTSTFDCCLSSVMKQQKICMVIVKEGLQTHKHHLFYSFL